jgi:hypothetical protein
MLSPLRNGNFTSSEIVALTTNGTAKGSFGKPFYTYIEECNMERRLGMALENDIDAKPTSWGKLIEKRPFEQMSTSYELCSHVTLKHPTIDFWYGSPDVKKYLDINLDKVGDLKCPMTRKSFCQMVDPYIVNGKIIYEALTIEAVRANHKDGNKYFWQIVSNAIITGCTKGELIVYMPYKSELDDIQAMASSAGEMGEYSKWIYFATHEQLPYILDGGYYKSINIIEFDILPRDVDFLTERVLKGGELLDPWKITL